MVIYIILIGEVKVYKCKAFEETMPMRKIKNTKDKGRIQVCIQKVAKVFRN
jgi:hypothetical protein